MYYKVALITLGLLMLLMLIKIIFKSPSIFYKIQSINTFTSLGILFLMIYVYLINQPEFIDLALIYIIINYIGIVIILKYVQTLYNKQSKG